MEIAEIIAVVMVFGGFLVFVWAIVTMIIRAIRKRKWKSRLIFAGASLAVLGLGVAIDFYSEQVKTETVTGPEVTPTPAPVETIDQILGKAANITSVRWDLVITAGGQTAEVATLRWKENKARVDTTSNGTLVVILEFAGTRTRIYYVPMEKRAEQQAMAAGEGISSSPAEIAKTILKTEPATLGGETVEGRAAVLIEGTDDDGVRYRAWIEKEHGFPLRQDEWTTEGKVTLELKNLEFFYIPDYIFELPPDVEVTVQPATPGEPAPSPSLKPSPSPVQIPETLPRLYVNHQFRYSIELLEGWTIDDSDKTDVLIRSADRVALVQIFANDRTTTLESATSGTASFRAGEQDYQELSRTKLMLPGGLPAYSIAAKWTTKGTTFLSRKLSVITVKTNRDIELIAGSTDTDWDKYRAQLEQIAYSLAIAD